MIKGKALKKGDTIGIINISMIMEDKERIEKIIEKIKSMEFNVKVGESCYSKWGYLSGDDNLRANDLNKMFLDKDVDAIVCLRGGYGAIRILDKIDYEIIKNNPKIFLGYSDVTAAHIAINKKTNLITFHGPMFIGEFEKGLTQETYTYLKKVLFEKNEVEYLNSALEILVDGEVTAPIIGGNLSVIASTLGTEYEIDTKDKILFIEDVNEPPYKIDSMLNSLNLAKKLDCCKGFIIGNFSNCEDDKGVSVLDVIKQIIIPKNKPTIYNFQAGHCKPNYVISIGAEVYLNTFESKIIIKDSSVI